MDLTTESRDYANRVSWYIDSTRIPDNWFGTPDHVTVTANDVADFEQLVKEPAKETALIDVENEERFLVAAKIAGSLYLGRLGFVKWLEIHEPTPVEQELKLAGIHTAHFYYQWLGDIQRVLGWRGIEHLVVDFGDHIEIDVPIDNETNKIRFTSRPFEYIARERKSKGEIKELLPRAA